MHALPGLEGKRVLVTGASAGIGRAVAVAFAASRAKVCIAARNQIALDNVIEDMAGNGHLAVVADLTKEEDCKRLVETAVRHLGGLDVLVNNGSSSTGEREDASLEQYMAMYDLHVSAMLSVTDAAVSELIRSKGCIVNVSCILGQLAGVMELRCHAALASREHLARCYALQLAQQGVRVNTVAPSYLRKTMGSGTGTPMPASLDVVMTAIHPLCRMAKPRDVAPAVLFLASDMASFITGVTLPVDGGLALTSWDSSFLMHSKIGDLMAASASSSQA